jgi:recombination protein RecT
MRAGCKKLHETITNKETMDKLKDVVPLHMKPEAFIRVVINQLNLNPKLGLCTPASFVGSILSLAAIGLEPDGYRAHLIPYGNICKYQLDYKGIVELVMRSGQVSHVSADVVREGDVFQWSKGRLVDHVPWVARRDKDKPENPGPVFLVYALACFKDGSERAELMSEEDVLAVRDGSEGWKAFTSKKIQDSAWNPVFPHKAFEMYKKTVFKRLSKWLPLSSDIKRVIDSEDRLEYGPASSEPRTVVAAVSSVGELTDRLRQVNESAKDATVDATAVDAPTDSVTLESEEFVSFVDSIENWEDTNIEPLQAEIEMSNYLTAEEKSALLQKIYDKKMAVTS